MEELLFLFYFAKHEVSPLVGGFGVRLEPAHASKIGEHMINSNKDLNLEIFRVLPALFSHKFTKTVEKPQWNIYGDIISHSKR